MYVIYARRFGWTPAQVDELPISVESWILPIDDAIEADIAARQERAAKARKPKHAK